MCDLLQETDLDHLLSSRYLTAFVPSCKAFKNYVSIIEKSEVNTSTISGGEGEN